MWSTLSWVAITILTALLYLLYRKEKRKFKDVDKIPGPPTKFFFGNATEFGNSSIESFNACSRLIKTYGPFVRIWLGPLKVNFLITDPNYVEYFLTSTVHLNKSSEYNLFKDWIGQGLVTSTGEKWKRRRRILTPAFHFKILEQFTSTFHNEGKILIEKLKRKSGSPIDIYKYLMKYALDVMFESSMRISAKENADEYFKASKTFLAILTRRFFSVVKRNDFMFRFCPEYKEHKKSIEFLHGFTMSVIQQRKKERLETGGAEVDEFGIKKKKTFLDILLDTNELTDVEIREEVDTFLLAGHESIGSAVGFAVFELAKHSEAQRKLLQEIHEVVGVDKNAEITTRHLQDMTYLDCVMKEILRLYPPGSMFERQLAEDVVLDGVKMPRGSTLIFHPYMQHRNEDIFPDPEKFDPDRFLPHNTAERHPFAYIPFSAGPRNCIGSKYAMIKLKATTANLIRNFEIRPVIPEHALKLATEPVLKSLNGMPIILDVRK